MDVKAVITDLNMTPSEFARKLGVSKGHVGDLISRRRKPSLRLAADIAKLAGRKSLLNDFVRERVEA